MSEGVLVVVGTPIGNLDDLSPRAAAALGSADLLACEDTRRTRKLLSAAGIRGVRLIAVHDHNEASMVDELLGRLRAGARVALVSDAGMPVISDPGERVVRAAVAAGIRVEVVPGPDAAVAALVASGLPASRWCFEGFLPRKGADRRRRLAAIAAEPRTTVVFESPPRLVGTLEDLAHACGPGRRVVVARELTKLHEELWRGTLGDAAAAWADPGRLRGEIVLVVDGSPESSAGDDDTIVDALLARRAAGDDRRAAVSAVATHLDVPRRRVYALAVELWRQERPSPEDSAARHSPQTLRPR